MSTFFADEAVNSTEVIIQKDNLLYTVDKLEKSFNVSFELFITKHISAVRCALHLTIDGRGGKFGERIPLVLLLPGGNLAVRSAVNDQQDYQYNGNMRLREGKWYNIYHSKW